MEEHPRVIGPVVFGPVVVGPGVVGPEHILPLPKVDIMKWLPSPGIGE